MKRILVGSPIRQDPQILQEFLRSLLELETPGIDLDFAFVDDNEKPASRELLAAFRPKGQVTLLPGQSGGAPYLKSDQTHHWREDLVWKVAAYKDEIIALARDHGYDGLLFIDSDLILHPATLLQLVEANVDIISEVYWTRWQPDQPELPQVWLQDHYELYAKHRAEQVPPDEAQRRTQAFLTLLRRPGVVEVGGLGALTLISRRALTGGISFRQIPNLSIWGEDRHFCIRAQALGFRLHVDTHYPALHLYREADLARLPAFRAQYGLRRAEVEALKACRAIAEAWGSSHPWSGPKSPDDFTGAYRAVTEQQAAQVAASGTQAISRLDFIWAHPTAVNAENVLVQGAIRQLGMENDRPYSDHMGFEAAMVREGGRWRMAAADYQPRTTPPPPVPFVRKTRNNRVTLSMVVTAASRQHLEKALTRVVPCVDDVVLLLDGSAAGADDDRCRALLAAVPHTIVPLERSLPESDLRRLQWEVTAATRPDWILNLNPNEVPAQALVNEIRTLLDQDETDLFSFRVGEAVLPLLVRCHPNLPVRWDGRDRFPDLQGLPRRTCPIPIDGL